MPIYCECCKIYYNQIIPHYKTKNHKRNAEQQYIREMQWNERVPRHYKKPTSLIKEKAAALRWGFVDDKNILLARLKERQR